MPREGYVLTIPAGQSVQKIVHQLASDKVIEHPQWFVLWLRTTGVGSQLKAGEYLIQTGMTPQTAAFLIQSGKVIQHALTIVEGWNFLQLMNEVNQAPKLTHTLIGLTPAEIMAKLGSPLLHPEGRFFPDTYYFPAGTTDVAFLQRAFNIMENRLEAAWNSRAPTLPLKSKEEALILASIVERESSVLSEYPDISGVFIRRLERKMPLQADPTVIYGLGKEYTGQLRSADLQKNSPYNTYINPGLPPTPIAMPGQQAITAAIHPKEGDALYFVAEPEGPGHVFSKTLAEHEKAVLRYRSAKAQKVPNFSSASPSPAVSPAALPSPSP